MKTNSILYRCALGVLMLGPYVAQADPVGMQVPAYISLRLITAGHSSSALSSDNDIGKATAINSVQRTHRVSRKRAARSHRPHQSLARKHYARQARNRQRCMQARYEPSRTNRHRCAHFLIRQGPLARPRVSL